MNYKEYKKDEDNHVKGIHYWANKCRQIQKSLKYNPDPNATVRHHLRDTEEQRKYNDEHYEMWGFEIDENGNEHFEYGKYIIFVTHDEHSKIHGVCEETRKKLSEANKGRSFWTDERRLQYIEHNKGNTYAKGRKQSDEAKKKISEAHKGKILSDEHRKKLSEAHKGKILSDEHKRAIGKASSENMTDEMKKRLSESVKQTKQKQSALYKEYKKSGGKLTWNEFTSYIKTNNQLPIE